MYKNIVYLEKSKWHVNWNGGSMCNLYHCYLWMFDSFFLPSESTRILRLHSSWARMLPWTFLSGLRTTRSCCCAEGPCSLATMFHTRTEKHDEACRGLWRATRSSATTFVASSRVGHTLVGMRWQDCVAWDLVTSRRLWMPLAIYTNDVAPSRRQALTQSTTAPHYTSNITALGDFGTTMDVIGNAPMAYTNDAAASRRRARTPP
jgi:hypothetical protein